MLLLRHSENVLRTLQKCMLLYDPSGVHQIRVRSYSFLGHLSLIIITVAVSQCFNNNTVTGHTVRSQKYRADVHYFTNESGNKLPTWTFPEIIVGKFRLAEGLQYLRVQNRRHPVYQLQMALGIVSAIVYPLWSENDDFW